MLELIVTVVITLSSVLMFGYWFRYTCLLIVSATTTRDYAMNVATANQLSFLQVQTELRGSPADLDRLKASLDRDMAVVTYLIQNASGQGAWGMEDRIVQLNYKVMGAWCSISKSFSPEAARRALDEMSMIVSHFANTLGERAAVGAAA
jgi:hypothetical protein